MLDTIGAPPNYTKLGVMGNVLPITQILYPEALSGAGGKAEAACAGRETKKSKMTFSLVNFTKGEGHFAFGDKKSGSRFHGIHARPAVPRHGH